MDKIKVSTSSLIFIFITYTLISCLNIYAQNNSSILLENMILSIDGISENEKQELKTQLSSKFNSLIEQDSLNSQILQNTEAIINAGIFEQASISVIADIAHKAYIAEQNGAPGDYIRDIALIGIATTISASQLEIAARSIKRLMSARIDPIVIEDFISYSLYNGWNSITIEKTVSALIEGKNQQINEKQLALCIIIGIDKEIAVKNIDTIIQESINFLKNDDENQQEETNRQQVAYKTYQQSVAQGLPKSIAEEIYFTAIEEKWEPNTIQVVYSGLVTGCKKGLTPERLATSIIIRLAQENKQLTIEKLVEQEIKFVANIEKKRSQLIQQDQKKYKREQPPIPPSKMPYLQPRPKPEQPKKSKPTYFNAARRSSVNQQLMWQNMQEYLGPPSTPYRWGGTSRSGIDCSGFVLNIYLEQGIYLPRTSAQQYRVGQQVIHNLQFGDLVFFSKYGPAYKVTHVGVYIGGDKFVHSSASKGVTISSLNKKYYRLRFKGAKRML